MPAIYLDGTVAVTNGNAVVTGTGTAWAVALVTGGLFSCSGAAIPILSVEGDTSLTLAYPWPGTTASGAAYAIDRESSAAASIIDLNDKVTRILTTMTLVGVRPDKAGTLAERDALTLTSDDAGFIFCRIEIGDPEWELYEWNGTDWVGPGSIRGLGGVGVGGLGLPTPGAAGKFPYYSGASTIVLGDITTAGRALLDDANAAAQLTTLGVSTFIKTLIDDADAATARATLGLSAAVSFSTSLTTQLLVGGTGVGSSLSVQSTSGAGSADFINFLVGNNGAIEAARFDTSGLLTIKKGLASAAGTASIAPWVMTAGANLTTAAAGAWEYDGKALYFAHAASSRGVVAVKQIATVQGSTVALVNNVTTAQSLFAAANDTLTLLANTSYRFRAKIGLNTGATSHATSFGLGGTATFTSISYLAQAISAAANTLATPQMRRVESAAAAALTAASTAVTTDIWIEGVIRTNAAGTIIPQVTFSAGPTGTCETAVNSFFEIEPIGADTVAAVGNFS